MTVQIRELGTLRALLLDLFELGELRRFAADFAGADLATRLPAPPASADEVSFAVVQGLRSRGLIDATLFRALRTERPRRRAAIDAVAARVLSRETGRRAFLLAGLAFIALVSLVASELRRSEKHGVAPEPGGVAGDAPNVTRDPPLTPARALVPSPALAAVPTTTPLPAVASETRERVPGARIGIVENVVVHAPGGKVQVIGYQGHE